MILLEKGESTPAPWINVIANPRFGFQVSAEGSGYTWAENSRENQLTPWSNDPVGDPCVEAFYLRDEDSRALWSVTARPIRDDGLYSARHGFGYSRFGHRCQGIDMDLVQFVALADPIKISRLVLRNLSGKSRRLSFTSYAEPVLGSARATSAAFIETCQDVESGALLARNPWNAAFPGRVLFADLCGRQSSWSGDRREFLGPLGDPSAPAALLGEAGLSGCTGAGSTRAWRSSVRSSWHRGRWWKSSHYSAKRTPWLMPVIWSRDTVGLIRKRRWRVLVGTGGPCLEPFR
ncbi:hypothetical protein [Pseudomonas aeruginosa]|uniref:hypothetical protein n=1 Tax=Pseudomonas aeruginosa TaxID=287 RepID=UPI000A755FAC|nr:hypothetical protein [Pseudomonas aeruginosa]